MIIHWHVSTNSLLHPLFLTPKIKYLTRKDQVWYMKTPVGKNMLCLLSKQLTNDLLSLKGKQITNKTTKGLKWWMHLFQLSMAWRFLGIVILNHMWSKHSKLLYYFIFQVWIFGHLFFSHILDVDQSLSFCRYDQTNQGIHSHVMQHIISSEVNGDHALSLKKLLFKNKKLTRSLRYFNFLFIFSIVLSFD